MSADSLSQMPFSPASTTIADTVSLSRLPELKTSQNFYGTRSVRR
ncbi:MAG: hypothetical protein ABJZ55_24005 [Fuerstiella sp.]